MAAFRFRLQKVLEQREETERVSAKGLAVARAEADTADRAREDLEAAREAGRVRLARAHGSGGAIGHLRNLAYVVDRVDDQIRAAAAVCEEANEHVVEKLKSYHRAFTERKTIDQLRERRLEQWREDEARSERKTMDEVALSRHARSDRRASAVGE
jgi:flagellar protein FliJ